MLSPGDDPDSIARSADAEVLGVAGGDGSLAPVAAIAAERGLPFVCIPFGTRNHFARDLGLNRDDTIGTLAAFAGRERLVDLGIVDGRPFLNNVSFGVYADLVERREHHRRRGEAFAATRAWWRLARGRPLVSGTLDGRTLRTRVVFVGNNRYDLTLFDVGERQALDEGRLHIYTAESWVPTRWHDRAASRFELELSERRTRAAADGEPLLLDCARPLVFESRAGALRVLVPEGGAR